MTRFTGLYVLLFIAFQSFGQTSDLSQFSYVIVPNQFDFQKGADQYQLNSMSRFYFEKSGFNAFLAADAPNADRCDGLYADVEELKAFLGTKVQVVLRDCKKNEIYRGPVGKSKYKEFVKSYQDALRKAFLGLEMLEVKQKDVIILEESALVKEQNMNEQVVIREDIRNIEGVELSTHQGLNLPSENYSNYSHDKNSFLLRKTGEGYSLYQESATAGDDLVLLGKIIIMDMIVKYMDVSGKVENAAFDGAGTLTIGNGSAATVYTKVKN